MKKGILPYLRQYRHYLFRHKKAVALGFGALFITNIFGVAKPLVLKAAIDDLEREFVWQRILLLAVFIVVLAIFQGIFRYLQRQELIGASRKAEYLLRNDFVAHLQKLSLSFYDRNSTGDIMARASSDINAVRMAWGPGVMYSLDTVVISVFSLTMMMNLNYKLTLIAFSIFPLVSVVMYIIGKKSHYFHNLLQEAFSRLNTFAQENISGVRVVKSFALEDEHITRFEENSQDYFKRGMDLVKVQALFIPLLYFLLGIGVLVIIWFGGKGIIAGRMTLGSFAAFVAYLMMLAWPMMAVGWVVNILERAEASMERIHKIMSAPIDIADIEGAVELKDVIARVQIQNLNFNYGSFKETKTGGDGWTLSDINLEINPGTTVGIVGSVGSGKSTLVKLLPRLYDPPKGTIFINGSAVEAINLDSLRNMIAFVPQDTFLFSESISENIDFQGVIAKDLFLEVCRQAGLAKDLELFPQGYDTIVGERGVTLSGGQKQRVSLARALLKSAPILIIDDALTAVDAETEAEILSNLRSVFKGKTVIMVTHRISTVKDFDLIIVLKEGRIVEKGDHNYLVLKEGEYYRLYRRQLLEQELNMI